MKKTIAILLAALLLMGLTACSFGPFAPAAQPTPEPVPAETQLPAVPEENAEGETPTDEQPAEAPPIVIEQPENLEEAPMALSDAQRGLLEQLIFIDETVTIATAGSSLRCAAAAASLLDWAESVDFSDDMIPVVIEYMAAKDIDGQAEFDEKLGAVDGMVQLLTGDDHSSAEGLLSDAGLENTGYPWSGHAIQVIEQIMQQLGRRIA